jgi:hypothetical protein
MFLKYEMIDWFSQFWIVLHSNQIKLQVFESLNKFYIKCINLLFLNKVWFNALVFVLFGVIRPQLWVIAHEFGSRRTTKSNEGTVRSSGIGLSSNSRLSPIGDLLVCVLNMCPVRPASQPFKAHIQ